MTRLRFRGQALVDALLDIPIVLPPLVIGLSLLILFQTAPLRALERVFPVTYAVPSIILAQFMVSCAFAVRTMRATFEQISPRHEQVALTLGCKALPSKPLAASAVRAQLVAQLPADLKATVLKEEPLGQNHRNLILNSPPTCIAKE